MQQTVENFLAAVTAECKRLNSEELPIAFNERLKDKYFYNCSLIYKEYKKRYMRSTVRNLDRHKIAAIMVTEGAALDLIQLKVPAGDKYFVGKERILLTCALLFLRDQFNYLVEQDKDRKISPMSKLVQPIAFSCDTEYIDIMSRTLFYLDTLLKKLNQDSEDALLVHLNIVRELAEKFFLLEYIAIAENYGEDAKKVYDFLRKEAKESEKRAE